MRQFMLFRLLITVVGFLLLTLHVTYLSGDEKARAARWLYLLLSVYACFGIGCYLVTGKSAQRRGVQRAQLAVDFLTQAILIAATGGVLSIFIPVLFVTLVSATAIASPRESIFLATVVTVFLCGTTIAYGIGRAPATVISSSAEHFAGGQASVSAYLMMSALALYAISVLGSKFSARLRYAENLQEEAFENMGQGIVVVDRQGRVAQVNGQIRNMLGLDGERRAYEGLPVVQVLELSPVVAARADLFSQLVEALLEGSRDRVEFQLRAADGFQHPIRGEFTTLSDADGKLRSRIGLFSDRWLECTLAAKDSRIHKLEELQRMALGLAHEIRNPLASIRGCVQEIARLTAEESAQSRFSRIVIKESDRLDSIIEDFQRYARQAPARMVRTDLREVLDRAADLLRSREDFAARRLLWERPACACTVRGDPDQLLQVILNLGINALQATEPETGSIAFEVRLRARRRGDQVSETDAELGTSQSEWEVAVTDNGAGIPESDRESILMPFFTTKHEGTGLGLSIVSRIVEQHSGRVEVGNASPGGAILRVILATWLEGDVTTGEGSGRVVADEMAAAIACS